MTPLIGDYTSKLGGMDENPVQQGIREAGPFVLREFLVNVTVDPAEDITCVSAGILSAPDAGLCR